MTNELKDFKVLGYTTDFQQCECCGKTNLKGTVSILDLNSDVVLHFGSTCATNADKYDSLEAAKKAKKEIGNVVRDYKNAQQFGWTIAWKLLRNIYGKDAHITAPKADVDFYTNDCAAWYTNPDNKFKAYPHPSLKFANKN